MSPNLRFSLVRIVVVLWLAPGPAYAQYGTGGGEWPGWAGDLGATRYAPLDQIDAEHFADLEVAWRFSTVPAPWEAKPCVCVPKHRLLKLRFLIAPAPISGDVDPAHRPHAPGIAIHSCRAARPSCPTRGATRHGHG